MRRCTKWGVLDEILCTVLFHFRPPVESDGRLGGALIPVKLIFQLFTRKRLGFESLLPVCSHKMDGDLMTCDDVNIIEAQRV